MAQPFSTYDYIGVIAPGSVVALGLALQWPELKDILKIDGVSLGDLGALVLAAFVLGHLVQALGNILETAFWAPFGGMPTQWVRKPGRLISADQRDAVRRQLLTRLDTTLDLDKVDKDELASVVPQIFSNIRAAGRADRLDTYNRNYGLLRGLTSAFLVLGVWLVATHRSEIQYGLFALAAAAVAWIRAWRFGRYYGRDLYIEFLNLPPAQVPQAGASQPSALAP